MLVQLKNITKNILQKSHRLLSVFDFFYIHKEVEYEHPPVFIIGPPRSGTSLLYQVMTQAFQFAYLPNLANMFYQCPITATKISKTLFRNYKSTFRSSHGNENGIFSPSEAGNVWNRWFPHEKKDGFNYTDSDYLTSQSKLEINRMVMNISKIFDAPFLSKNVKMSVRLPALQRIFPDAKFVQIKRNPVDVAASLLQIRRKKNINWWSAMPSSIELLHDLPEIESVVGQVFGIEDDIKRDLSLLPLAQQLVLTYDDLCSDTHSVVSKISDFMNMTADLNEVPRSFPQAKVSPNEWVSAGDIAKIKLVCAERCAKN